jgi:hypothetical protein
MGENNNSFHIGMSNRDAIAYLEYIQRNHTKKGSPAWHALQKGIDAIKAVDNVQSCLGNKAASAAKDGAE